MAFRNAGLTKVKFMEIVYESPPQNRLEHMPKTNPVGFRPTKELADRLETAQNVTGKDLTYLLLKCVERSLDGVVLHEVEQMKDDFAARQKAAREFLKVKKAA
jgi:hypothetical protein